MDHVAIMTKSTGFIEKILNGTKTIESRWYKHRVKPWNSIFKGEKVYFKYSGNKIIAVTEVIDVLEFEDLDENRAREIIKKYGKEDGIGESDYDKWAKDKKYCILIFLKYPKRITKPFGINKRGFGSASAWITVDNIERIKVNI